MGRIELEFLVKNEVSKNIKLIERDLKRLQGNNAKATASFGVLAKSMIALAGSAYLVNKAYGATIKRGLEYNNLLENQKNSIATLINVTSKNVDSQGKSLNYQNKMNLALANSNELMAELTRLNANTPQTLGQTAQIFKTMYAPMAKVGASQKDMLYLTEKLAIASKVGGVEFNSLLAGVDGLASGTVLANSDLGRFLSSLGITNEKIKASGNVIELLKGKLKDFKAFDDLDTAMSNLNVEFDTLTGNMSKDIYTAQKESIKVLSGLIKQLSDEDMKALREGANTLASGLVSATSAFLRFGNGSRIMVEDVTTGVENSLSRVEIFFKEIEVKFLRFSKDMSIQLYNSLGKNAFDKLGLSLPKGITRDIIKLETDILRLGKGIKTNNAEFESFRNSALKINDIILATEDKFKNTLSTVKEITAENEKQAKLIGKNAGKTTKAELIKLDIGGDISTAIIDGINGSGLESILKNFSSSVGSTLINQGVGSIGASLDPVSSIALGVGATVFSSLMGGDSNKPSSTELANEEFTTFIENLNKASEELNNFRNEGDVRSNELELLNAKIAENDIELADAESRANTNITFFGSDPATENNLDARISERDQGKKDLETFNILGDSLQTQLKGFAKETLAVSVNLEDELELLNAKSTADKLAITDGRELAKLSDDANKATQQLIFDTRDAIARQEERSTLQEEYDLLTGVTTARKLELESLDESNQALQTSINKEEDRQIALAVTNEALAKVTANEATLSDRLELLNATNDADKLAITRARELLTYTDAGNKAILNSIFLKEDEIANLALATTQAEEFSNAMETLADSMKSAIDTIRGNLFESDTQGSTNDLIRQYNQAVDKGDYDLASNLATTISGSAFGDTSALNSNLINDLQSNLLNIGFEDEILNVNIVGSNLTSSTPVVNIGNGTTNETLEKKLDDIATLLISILTNSTKDLKIQQEFQNIGITTVSGA